MKTHLMETIVGILVAAGLLFAGYMAYMNIKLVNEAVEIMLETTRWIQAIIPAH